MVSLKLRERTIKSDEVRSMRIDYLRDSVQPDMLAEKYNVSVRFASDVIHYLIRDEADACPDSAQYTRLKSQYNLDPDKRPYKVRNPWLTRDQVIAIRLAAKYSVALRCNAGSLARDDSPECGEACNDMADDYGISIVSLHAVVNFQVFLRQDWLPTKEEIDTYLERVERVS